MRALLAAPSPKGHHPFRALRDALVQIWPIAAASLLPLAIILIAEVLGTGLATAVVDRRVLAGAAWISLWASVALLGGYS